LKKTVTSDSNHGPHHPQRDFVHSTRPSGSIGRGQSSTAGRPVTTHIANLLPDSLAALVGGLMEKGSIVIHMTQGSLPDARCCAVVELRQYTLKPGQRDTLIDLFERHFIEGQESVGMTLIGQFRDRRRPDHFVWLRGFPDMERRHQALEAFYGGPIWGRHREQANDTMLDSDDVLLLRPARPETTFRISTSDRSGTFQETRAATVLAGIYRMPAPPDDGLVSRFESGIVPMLRANGIDLQGLFVTESARNTFPRLPVREGENVLVWFGTIEPRQGSENWREWILDASRLGQGSMALLELEPTSRSLLGRARLSRGES
jgi:hypothetical protein